MKYFLTLFATLIISSSLKAQISYVQFEGKKYDIQDTSYHFSETIQVIFYENNGPAFWKLRSEVRSLDFDHCNHSFMFFLYVDTTGLINKIQLLEGCNQPSTDSIVNAKLSTIQHVIPVNYNGAIKRTLIVLRFRYFSNSVENSFPNNYSTDKCDMLYKKITLLRQNYFARSNQTNECEDDLYFYNEGVNLYNSAKYSKAIYNFTQALEANPADLEAKYYLGLAYQKQDNLKKACRCFSEGAGKGHAYSIDALNKYCSSVSDK